MKSSLASWFLWPINYYRFFHGCFLHICHCITSVVKLDVFGFQRKCLIIWRCIILRDYAWRVSDSYVLDSINKLVEINRSSTQARRTSYTSTYNVVLGVIRTSRPSFWNSHDILAFAIHAFFRHWLFLMATGSQDASLALPSSTRCRKHIAPGELKFEFHIQPSSFPKMV